MVSGPDQQHRSPLCPQITNPAEEKTNEPSRKETAMNTAPVPVPVHLNVNYIADLNRKIIEQQATITALTEITKSLFSAADKTRPCFRRAVKCFNALWETGAI